MDPIAAALQKLWAMLAGGQPVAGPPTPGAAFAGPGGTMTGNPNAPGQPGMAGTPGLAGLLTGSGTAGGGAPGGNLAMIMQLLTALGGGYYGSKQLSDLQTLFEQQQSAAQKAMNPVFLARRAAKATAPLNAELAYVVNQAADLGSAGRGMAQSPGAVASARAQALAPYAQKNLELGTQLATFGFPYQYATQAPDYTSVLNELNQMGRNTTFSLPSGVTP